MGLLNAIGGLFQSDEDRKVGNLNALQRFGIALGQEGHSAQDIPAALQMTNEFLRAQQAGDVDRANALQMFAKTLDKGVVFGPQGQAMPLAGYPQALGQIAGVKAGAEQQERKNVDLTMNPQIISAENLAKLTTEPQITAANKAATLKSESKTQQEISLPDVIANAEIGLNAIDQMIGNPAKGIQQHPGLSSAVGPRLGLISPALLPDEASNFTNLLEQAQGGAFLDAYKTLKGGGQITEVEGSKATSAINRMKRASTEEAFVKAAQEYREIIQKGIDRAKQKAQGNYSVGNSSGAPTAPAITNAPQSAISPLEGKTATNPKTGERLIFRGGKWSPLQ